MKGIDLHIHTNASPDGDLQPEEIFRLAKKSEVTHIAITDHNSISGLKGGNEHAKKYGVNLIPGVEFNSSLNGRDVHILAYFIDPENPVLNKLIEEIKMRKELQGRLRTEKLKGLGFEIEYDSAVRRARGDIPNGSIFFDALSENKRNRENSVFRRYIDGDRSDSPHFNFYMDYFRYGMPAYAPLTHIETKRVIETVSGIGGIPVLAHPFDTPDEEIKKIIDSGIRGIEVYSSYHSSQHEEHFLKIAKKYNLIYTAGSDFHGSHKPKVKLGIFIREAEKIIEELAKFGPS